MDWMQILTLIGANVGMVLWMIRESNQDRRDAQNLIREIRKDVEDFHIKLALQDQEYKNHLINMHKGK